MANNKLQQEKLRSSSSSAGPTGNCRTISGILFWICVLFIFYETAMPFRFDLTRSGLRYRLERSEWIPFLDNDGSWLSLADAVGNVLLFVPFGFFLHHWRLRRRSFERADKVDVRTSLLAALFYSAAIEILQLSLDRRTTSANDLITNFVGAYLGAKLALADPGLIEAAWNRIRQIFRTHPAFAAWLAIMLVQIFIALPPFDFTLQQENFQRQLLRWQYSCKVLPSLWQSSAATWQHFPPQEHLLVKLLGTVGCGLTLGALVVYGCRRYWTRSPGISGGSLLITLCLYPLLTILQFTVQSIHPVVFFPLAGSIGVMSGMFLMSLGLQIVSLFSRSV
jgi:hypothetical protein